MTESGLLFYPFLFVKYMHNNLIYFFKNHRFFWLMPFLFFLFGYFASRAILSRNDIITPSLIGCALQKACSLLAEHNLTMQLLTEKEHSDLPSGTILYQVPGPGQRIKPRQTVFLTISKKQHKSIAPLVTHKKLPDIEKIAQINNLSIQPYYFESDNPEGACFAQMPSAGTNISGKTMIIYMSQKKIPWYVWPSFIDKPLDQIQDFLTHYNIKPQVINIKKQPDQNILHVIKQHPPAGSIVRLDNNHLPMVQLIVQ